MFAFVFPRRTNPGIKKYKNIQKVQKYKKISETNKKVCILPAKCLPSPEPLP